MRLGSILVVALAALAAAAHGLQPDQCASWILNLKDGRLLPDESPLWLNFTEAGTVQLIIRANMSLDAPVELAILDSQGRKIWAIGPSTRIVSADTVDLKAPGSYQLVVKNPVETRFATFFLNVTMCGGPALGSWLRQYIEPAYVTLNKTAISAATVGIVSYGVMEVGGQYFTYTLTTDAVKGVAYIPSNISASGYSVHFIPPDVPTSDYWWRNGTYYYYGQAFSVQLSAIVVARLKDGAAQYYWIQNIVGFDEKYEGLRVWNYIWNATSLILDRSAVSGKGEVRLWLPPYKYIMPGSIPFGRVELEMWARADDGKIIIEFYANGQKYDEVAITPRVPAVSAHVVIAPTTTSIGLPLALGLILGGYSDDIPFTVLNAGRIGLELYVRMNGSWVPPPSAWSIARFGLSHASVVPQGVGSALVVPGPPNSQQLWAGTVVVTPFGINITTSADLSPYAESLPKLVDLGNNTRLVLAAYVDGRPAQSLSNVTLGSLVVLQYKRQYLVSISAPGNHTAGWFDEGSTIVINGPPVVDLGNGTRLKPTLNGAPLPVTYRVTGPADLSVSYVKQYLVSLTSPVNRTAVWANASSPVVLNLPPVVDFGNGTRLVEPRINGTRSPLVVEVNRPMSFVGTYVNKQYLVTYSGPTWRNQTWINAGASAAFNPPQTIDFGNNTRLIDPLINGARPPLSISVDKPLSLSVEYARQYLVSINTPFNKTAVWVNAGASYTPPASATSRNGVTFVPAHLTIDGRRAPLAPVPVESPLDITVHYNAYAEIPTTFLGLPALYAEASITCGGATNSTSGLLASSLRLELIDAPAGKCSVSAHKVVPSLVLIVVVAVIAAIAVLFRKLHKRS